MEVNWRWVSGEGTTWLRIRHLGHWACPLTLIMFVVVWLHVPHGVVVRRKEGCGLKMGMKRGYANKEWG